MVLTSDISAIAPSLESISRKALMTSQVSLPEDEITPPEDSKILSVIYQRSEYPSGSARADDIWLWHSSSCSSSAGG